MRRLLAAAWPCAILLLLAGALRSAAVASSGAAAGRPEWQVLTRANFSSQIRLHPHVLLLVTMPWYGESRALMADIEHLVGSTEELGRLKLMVVYRNSEKLLTDAIGATEGINIVYYQHSVQFKYQGKLRARDILSSMSYIMSLKHEEAPFEVLHTKEDVDTFMESTDKSVLLYESCGWFSKLAHGGSNQSYEVASSNNHTENVDISRKTLTRESDGPLELVIEDEELTFGGGGQLTGSPWKGGFTMANESVSEQSGDTNDGNRKCTLQKFHQFESFYAKLTAIAREYFLPPEIARFGLITKRSLLPSLDVVNEGKLDTWFVVVHYLGCTTCSIIVKDEDDLRSLVQSHHNIGIKEVGADESGGEAIFPANRPSVDSLSVEEREYKTTDNSFATSDNPNDDTKVSVDENTAKETEYIDDGQAPSILEKTLTTYPDGHDNALESDVTEAEDQNKSEASDMRPDLHEEVSCNAYSCEVGEKNEKFAMKGFPAIYMIDCTSNECHHLLKSAGMEELYPTLLLFPAENKSAIAYEGGMSVAHLIEFLESHVSNSHRLLEYKVALTFSHVEVYLVHVLFTCLRYQFCLPLLPGLGTTDAWPYRLPYSRSSPNLRLFSSWCSGFMWKKRATTQHDAPQAIQFQISDKGSDNVGYDLPSHSDVVTGSILTATEKLKTAVPFDKAKVLIVSSDSHEGFQGLIINKRLSWGVFKSLDSSMEPIKHAPFFYGGPVVVQGYHLVSLSRVALEGYMQVIPGIYYGNIIATSRVVARIKSGEQSTDDLWFFLGYSGWGYNQLSDELSEGAWLVSEKPIENLDWPES
nr:unnamed protein product [Digitaria exilis]